MDAVDAFKLGKNAARSGQAIERNPFDKGDPRNNQWVEGYRSWRCKETLDLFDMMES